MISGFKNKHRIKEFSDERYRNSEESKLKPISEIGERLDIPKNQLIQYGSNKAKISNDFIKTIKNKKDGKLILVTAITPTPAGEGKTTTSVGLNDGLNKIGKRAVVCLREPSLGPCFGMKGGARVEDMHKWFQWKISIFTLQEIFMLSEPHTIFYPLLLIIIFTGAINLGLMLDECSGKES